VKIYEVSGKKIIDVNIVTGLSVLRQKFVNSLQGLKIDIKITENNRIEFRTKWFHWFVGVHINYFSFPYFISSGYIEIHQPDSNHLNIFYKASLSPTIIYCLLTTLLFAPFLIKGNIAFFILLLVIIWGLYGFKWWLTKLQFSSFIERVLNKTDSNVVS